ncbi:DUF2156 domain-containing protein [Candidatus Poribacteria bacterium]|nr:DUF2156 domain-containing protein [Candidatus Poribacteria bacterium]
MKPVWASNQRYSCRVAFPGVFLRIVAGYNFLFIFSKMQLQPLTLNNKPIFDEYAHRMCPRLSHYAFAPIYVWKEHFQFYWTLLTDYLCIFAKQGEDYFMPILPMPCDPENHIYRNVIRTAYHFMLESNRNPHIARIENVPQALYTFFQEDGFRVTLKETEYLYEIGTLSELRGNRFKSKRNVYNAFMERYPSAELRPYRIADREACFSLYDAWHTDRAAKCDDAVYCAMLEDSRSVHRIAIAHAEALGLRGRVVRIDGEISGYTFGYPLNADILCVLFEVTDLRIKGLAQFIYREFCKELVGTYRWINAMSDSGLDNLKRVKRSYHPIQLIPLYNVVSREQRI